MSPKQRTDAERRFDWLLGRQIMQARKARSISGVKLAGNIGIGYQRLYWIEAGERCSLFLAARIAAALGISLAELMPNGAYSPLSVKIAESRARRANSI